MEPSPEEIARDIMVKLIPQLKMVKTLDGKSGKYVAKVLASFYRELLAELKKT